MNRVHSISHISYFVFRISYFVFRIDMYTGLASKLLKGTSKYYNRSWLIKSAYN
jgi:hypothetical protein